MKRLDVAIVGGGLAGGLLARQLRRALPELRVALFEKSTAPGFKVGEATVEIAANHLIRKQGLSQYLYESQLPKNGLRYFFDSPDRDQALPEMSEVGSVNLPFHPAFQIDRARMETDLLEMNRRDGVEVHTGVRVEGIELGEDGAAHRFVARDAHGARSCAARWLVDAAGRGGLLARPLGLRVAEDRHRVGSVWGRFEGVADIDEVGPETFRTRVRHTSRRLSTIHFMYPGYWIWMIPLRGGLISVGVTGEEVGKRRELRTAEGLRGFLGRHRAVAELMADAKGVDLGSCARIAYGTRRYFHADRWALVGEAASAADPLYSPGSDFIALANDLLTDLVARDLGGESSQRLTERCDLYDALIRFRQEAAIRIYADLYGTLGSYDLACLKWDFDIGCYYNLWVASYMRDEHLDLERVRQQLRLEPAILRALQNFTGLFRSVDAALRERGDYFRGNTGQFYHGLTHIDFAERVGAERSEREVMETTAEIFNGVRARALALLRSPAERRAVDPLPLTAFLSDRALA